jgi:6-phosphogluconolactonase
MYEIRIYPDPQTLFAAAAGTISADLEETLRREETSSLVLAGGSTPKRAYELLAEAPHHERVDWSRVHFFWSDERCVPPDSRESNFGMARRALIGKLSIGADRVHRIRAESEDPHQAALEYEAVIVEALHHQSTPSFDLVVLGMGEDGHTASLFPGASWDEQRTVAAVYVPKLQAFRITMTPHMLSRAQRVVFIVSGESKAAALAAVLQEPSSRLPAGMIRPAGGPALWMVDAQAAAMLKDR